MVSRWSIRRRERGQTLIVALLIMGVLLALGFVFVGIVSRNILQTNRSLSRSVGGDLADSGVRFAHTQMLNSSLGADWRPNQTLPVYDVATGLSRDPDALYLRPASNLQLSRPDGTLTSVLDRGGPDGLGPFSRINFDKGRALIRVLYLPSDFDVFGSPSGILRQPGKARSFIRVEAIGRPGRLNPNDPTLLTTETVRVANYANAADLRASLASLKQVDSRNSEQKKLLGFVSVGLIEHTRFITNKYKVSREAELGSLTAAPNGRDGAGLGITTEANTDVEVPTILGGPLYDETGALVSTGSGSIYSNADLVLHGLLQTSLNLQLGDAFYVAGNLRAANDRTQVDVTGIDNNGGPVALSLSGNALNSKSAGFITNQGFIRDGVQDADAQGFPRAIGRKEAPSFLATDPATGLNRYLDDTRNSGVFVDPRFNSGRFGHGRGVFVDGSQTGDLQDEDDRTEDGANLSLVRDWLSPNNPYSRNWFGPYYIPIASYIQFLPDGFRIIRDSRSNNRFWRRPNGTLTSESSIRYRIRTINVPGVGFRTYILNSIANGAIVDQPANAITDDIFLQQGQPFNGLIYFEGDVRTRGVIPTDHQLTLVSMGSIYIEGSITKGVVREDGTVLNAPSRSMLMLMARNYTVVNTTMFFGPAPGENVSVKNVDSTPNSPNPVELRVGNPAEQALTVRSEFLLNPTTVAGVPNGNPTTWPAFARTYEDPLGSAITPTMVITHSADDRGPAAFRLSLTAKTYADPSPVPATDYRFAASTTFNSGVLNLYGLPNFPLYALTATSALYPSYESISIPMAGSTFNQAGRKLVAPGGNAFGDYAIGLQDSTDMTLRAQPFGPFAAKNYVLARAGMNPHDVRIEAAMFAENGSFFVIPGPTFNPNAEDTRAAFEANVTSLGSIAAAQDARFTDFGAMPETPFYNEPLNCRVTIVGAISENMPAPIGQQAEWQKKWGWMPRTIGGSGRLAPAQHVPLNWGSIVGNTPARYYLPNLSVQFDPALALGSADTRTPIRVSPDGIWVLPPMPRLPVSPSLAYFGEESP